MPVATAIEIRKPTEITQAPAMRLLELALEKASNIEVIERLAALERDQREYAAKVAFAGAFAQFKRTAPKIVKTAQIVVNGQVRGKYAPLDEICEQIIPALIDQGITHRWKTGTSESGKTTVTCYLRHEMGYEEEGSSMTASPDTSGSKNAIQADGSTVSYLQRYTLVTSCGIAIKGQDTDGIGGRIDDERGVELLEYLRDAETLEDLQKWWDTAKKEALEAKDSKAMAEFTRVKDEQKRKLQREAK